MSYGPEVKRAIVEELESGIISIREARRFSPPQLSLDDFLDDFLHPNFHDFLHPNFLKI